MGVSGQHHASAALPTGKRGGLVSLYQDSIPGLSSWNRVAVPIELSRPTDWSSTFIYAYTRHKIEFSGELAAPAALTLGKEFDTH